MSVFNDSITNVMSNFVRNEIIICEDRDPPWMKRHIKNCILYEDNFYKKFVLGKSTILHLLTFNNLQNRFK